MNKSKSRYNFRHNPKSPLFLHCMKLYKRHINSVSISSLKSITFCNANTAKRFHRSLVFAFKLPIVVTRLACQTTLFVWILKTLFKPKAKCATQDETLPNNIETCKVEYFKFYLRMSEM